MATLVRTDPVTGVETYTGFSWTTLFFGPVPALARRDWLGMVLGLGIIVVLMVSGTVILAATGEQLLAQVFTAAVWAIWAAVYNANHAARVG